MLSRLLLLVACSCFLNISAKANDLSYFFKETLYKAGDILREASITEENPLADELETVAETVEIDFVPYIVKPRGASRYTAFYSQHLKTIYFDDDILKYDPSKLIGLFLHEAISLTSYFDGDYGLSQLVYQILKCRGGTHCDQIRHLLAKVNFKQRLNRDIRFTDSIAENGRMFHPGGGSIVGGGGDYFDTVLLENIYNSILSNLFLRGRAQEIFLHFGAYFPIRINCNSSTIIFIQNENHSYRKYFTSNWRMEIYYSKDSDFSRTSATIVELLFKGGLKNVDRENNIYVARSQTELSSLMAQQGCLPK